MTTATTTANSPVVALQGIIDKAQACKPRRRTPVPMTDFDRRLVEKADKISKYQYGFVRMLVELADTESARNALLDIAWEDEQAVKETL